jgi:ABC-2 type transport system permease protein
VRHTAGAVTAVLAVVLAPAIAIGFLPENVAEQTERVALMAAGIAIQQTVERPGNLPLGPWEGLGVVSAYAGAVLLLALWLIARRDA